MNRTTSAFAILLTLTLLAMPAAAFTEAPVGYYRDPAIHGDTVVFVSEGDLWKVSVDGGVASRLTTHHGVEMSPAISPDGSTIAFFAYYEGPGEVYTMPLEGGLPTRRTWDGSRAIVDGFAPDGRVLFATRLYSTLPDFQLVLLDLESGAQELLPLAQAAQGAITDDGSTLIFTRLGFQGSHTKRYQGGTAQNLWRFELGAENEATPLTADYPGTSAEPMIWNDRVYFASDRDGTMNLWSMTLDGGELTRHTDHVGWDVKSPALHDGRIVYQLGADLRLYDINADADRPISITLDTDSDQTREKWVTKPFDYLTDAHLAPDGDRVALTARGEIFVAPVGDGRLVHVTRRPDVRYRDGRFMPDGDTLLALSDESGEVELWTLPANGMGEREQLTEDGEVLRWEAIPSPDGRWIAHTDKNWRLWLYDTETDTNRVIDESSAWRFFDLAWSPDSKWLAYVGESSNVHGVVHLLRVDELSITRVTNERYHSFSPTWDPNGEWLYYLSDRHFETSVGSPWGLRQPEPYFDRATKIYALALQPDHRSPFAPETELTRAADEEEDDDDEDAPTDEEPTEDGDGDDDAPEEEVEDDAQPEDAESDEDEAPIVEIDLEGLASRLYEVPAPPGNYGELEALKERLLWSSRADRTSRQVALQALPIRNKDPEVETLVDGIDGYELAMNREHLLIRRGEALYVVGAGGSVALDDDTRVDLSAWSFSITPREEWRQMFIEAWRLERDYFYDPNMHGVDWPAMLDKYLPLVDRVSDRDELADLIAQMVSEISALHTFVYGGDRRRGTESILPASLGARLERDADAGGYRVVHIYESDPDEPERRSPLAAPGVDLSEGDIITRVNGVATLDAPDIGALLRKQAGRQTLIHVKPAGGGEETPYIVFPISQWEASDLRYHEWEYTRRQRVEEASEGRIGYVHLRAMGSSDIEDWARQFYPVFNREGLIIDVRHNGGGNIDSWILARLLRRAWFYWQGRVGDPYWNMHYAFRGHMVVLCNEYTGSDGEAFTEGFRRLGLGEVIGTRTWGGEIWLSSSNFLVDGGIATAAEFGVYGPEGEWLIEGHGVDPDIVVDNLPHETFNGADAQLSRAIDHLLEKIAEDPTPVPPAPPRPDKSSPDNRPDP
ncbi:MAG: S41 family peptidase [Phycisphaerales bacterium]